MTLTCVINRVIIIIIIIIYNGSKLCTGALAMTTCETVGWCPAACGTIKAGMKSALYDCLVITATAIVCFFFIPFLCVFPALYSTVTELQCIVIATSWPI